MKSLQGGALERLVLWAKGTTSYPLPAKHLHLGGNLPLGGTPSKPCHTLRSCFLFKGKGVVLQFSLLLAVRKRRSPPIRGHFLLRPTYPQVLPTRRAEGHQDSLSLDTPQSMTSSLVLLSALWESKPTSFQDELSLQPLPLRPGFPTLVIPKFTSVATHRAHPRQNCVGHTAFHQLISHTPPPRPTPACLAFLFLGESAPSNLFFPSP